ncbi:ankyrin repeat domain-containing protein [Cerasicoccus frondis]|uniref:ankyrin repeat domain-containing protein n=1 Tax=Cerasicoccus frondis TaxID=490090 RepID=UPI0028528A89|nr:ankyrin repeat domain-containing protein [Cerasicoccus frondis]
MDSIQLPENPDLAQLKRQAKELLRANRANNADARAKIIAVLPGFSGSLTLSKAQLVIARRYGFKSWSVLKESVLARQPKSSEAMLAALLTAAESGDVNTLASILDEQPHLIDERGGEGKRTALHFAAWRGNNDAVQLLLDRLADPDIRCEGDNAFPIHFAAEQGFLEIVRLLLDHGADPNGFGDEHGLDVIGWATCFRVVHLDVAELLLANSARHNIYSAVALGVVDEIENLVKKYADALERPMASYEQRRLPVHLAVIKGQSASLEKLIALGARVDATDVNGHTALDLAVIEDKPGMVELLLGHGAQLQTPARIVLGQEVDVSAESVDKLMQLADLACQCGNLTLLRRMAELGVDLQRPVDSNAFGTKGYTLLHQAAICNEVAIVKFLVELGLSTSIEDDTYHATPLNWARYGKARDAAEYLEAIEVTG